MARTISSAVQAALAARALVARDFLWLTVKDRATGDAVTDGMWSGVETIDAPVVDPLTGASVYRTFVGAGPLVSISDIPAVSNITVQDVTITMSQVSDHVNGLIRTYDAKQGAVEIFRGLFDPVTRLLVDAAPCRWVGYINLVTVTTPTEDNEGSVVLSCTSATQEMTRFNPDTRSYQSQLLRSATDDFFRDTAVVGTWEHYWGEANGTLTSTPANNAAWAKRLGLS